jgi:hypothetical protein
MPQEMPLDMNRIFPISDAPSARLMRLKALCLYRAGVLTEGQRAAVTRQASEVLTRGQVKRSRHFVYQPKAA